MPCATNFRQVHAAGSSSFAMALVLSQHPFAQPQKSHPIITFSSLSSSLPHAPYLRSPSRTSMFTAQQPQHFTPCLLVVWQQPQIARATGFKEKCTLFPYFCCQSLLIVIIVERRPIDPPPVMEILDASTLLPPTHAESQRFFARVSLVLDSSNMRSDDNDAAVELTRMTPTVPSNIPMTHTLSTSTHAIYLVRMIPQYPVLPYSSPNLSVVHL